MAHVLSVEAVSKSFKGVAAVRRCSLELKQGEIVALLGPSGCGKTTLLNMIAGFEVPDEGRIELGGRDITRLPAHQRRAGMVFQAYALFPHMTVRDNILYGPRVQGEKPGVAQSRASEVADLLRIGNLLDRYPSQLSGGQRQRVAVARALATRPEILLLDEAFSALDRNLREEMQIELSLLLRRLGISTILVTHDQREAFALADRIAVMEAGRISQIDAPEAVYRTPKTPFVFEFLGSSNHLAATVGEQDGTPALLAAGGKLALTKMPVAQPAGSALTIGIRAEGIRLATAPTRAHRESPAVVRLVTFLGQTIRMVAEMGDISIISEVAAVSYETCPRVGDAVFLDIDETGVHVLDNAVAA
ncbi:MAG: ABC transporter ATP-binding protein [Pseudolabrys sp.]|nr:ABC transporter ATP-binding protein [Pseudolabrys sp.]